MTLAVDEFIRRFLIHVLPDGFHRIRHYGLFANGGAPRASRERASCSMCRHHRMSSVTPTVPATVSPRPARIPAPAAATA
jgi:hypothetical protein